MLWLKPSSKKSTERKKCGAVCCAPVCLRPCSELVPSLNLFELLWIHIVHTCARRACMHVLIDACTHANAKRNERERDGVCSIRVDVYGVRGETKTPHIWRWHLSTEKMLQNCWCALRFGSVENLGKNCANRVNVRKMWVIYEWKCVANVVAVEIAAENLSSATKLLSEKFDLIYFFFLRFLLSLAGSVCVCECVRFMRFSVALKHVRIFHFCWSGRLSLAHSLSCFVAVTVFVFAVVQSHTRVSCVCVCVFASEFYSTSIWMNRKKRCTWIGNTRRSCAQVYVWVCVSACGSWCTSRYNNTDIALLCYHSWNAIWHISYVALRNAKKQVLYCSL